MWRSHEKSGYFFDGCWWIRFYVWEGVILWLCGSSSDRKGWRLCAILPSHTLWQEIDEKDSTTEIFFHVRSYYLTCSYNPPENKHKRNVDNQTGESWSSLFLVLRWVVYYTCFTPVNVISLSGSAKLTFMFPNDSFQPWFTGIIWRKCRFDNYHWNWTGENEYNQKHTVV